ncbi:MAG: hypothetical protein H0T46_29970 [Deltaproteobacteria bacterium]|nr:hypothetical protein [Deltaproteobacteria bacterium]
MTDDEYFKRWETRLFDSNARHGIPLPVVDYEAPELRERLGCDEDALAKFLVEHFVAEHNAFEVIVEAVTPGRITVLFAATTKDLRRRFREYQLIITLGEGRDTFAIESETMTFERSDLVRVNMPRWRYR